MALAACIREARSQISAEQIGSISQPVLVAVGTKDDVAGDVNQFASLLPNAEVCDIPNRNHMLAVGDKVYKQAALEFLSRQI